MTLVIKAKIICIKARYINYPLYIYTINRILSYKYLLNIKTIKNYYYTLKI